MTKHQYLLRDPDLAGYGAFRERILADLVPCLEREAFMREWFGRHTPMSLRIHPLWNYVCGNRGRSSDTSVT